jgi:hypothetical protein
VKRFLIEREIPNAGAMTPVDLCHAAQKSNEAIAGLAPRVQWQHSYVAGDRIFCIYLADDETGVREHARLSGVPANRIVPIGSIIDPVTGNAG